MTKSTSVIYHYANQLWNSFWTPSFWLPPNVTWEDFRDSENVVYPKFIDMCYPVIYSVFVVAIRFIIERYQKRILSSILSSWNSWFFDRYGFMPLALSAGLKPNKRVARNSVLEQAFLSSSSKEGIHHNKVVGLAKQLDWSEHEVQEWYLTLHNYIFKDALKVHAESMSILLIILFSLQIRMKHRRDQNRPSALVKFTESGWRFTYYSFSVCYGFWALWDKPWFWNINESWKSYPHQVLIQKPHILWFSSFQNQ